VSRLIQLNVIRAGHDHHDDAAVLALLDRTSELRSYDYPRHHSIALTRYLDNEWIELG
jgi:hypothetical protein